MTDLAAWIRRSVELLLCPAVDHLPFLLSPTRDPEPITVQLVIFHDHPINEPEKYGMFQTSKLTKLVRR